MTKGKKTTTGKGEVKKLELKKDTLKDLDAKKAKDVKGGYAPITTRLEKCDNC